MTSNWNLPPGALSRDLERDEPTELTCPRCLVTLPVDAFDVDLHGNAECPECGKGFVRE